MNLFRRHYPAFITFIFLVFTVQAFSQTPTATPPPPQDDEVIKVDSRLVVVPVSVTDAAGQPVLGLTVPDFRIAEEGKQQQIEQVSDAEKVPLEIALLFDISASTDPMFKFEQETAAKFLREVMRPGDHASVFTIGERPIIVKQRDTAENAAVAITNIVPTKQFTAFYDTVAAAAEFLRKAPPGTRRVVVVISDGEDTNSTRIAKAIQDGYTKLGKSVDTLDSKKLYELTVANRNQASVNERNRVMQNLQNADTVFYSINPAGSSYKLNKISMYGQENMEQFAVETGGTAFLPQFGPTDLKDKLQNFTNTKKNTAILENIFRKLANELRAQYLVQYYSEAEYTNNRFVKLDVGLTNGAGRQLRARRGYFSKK